jgi:hypothetical protein
MTKSRASLRTVISVLVLIAATAFATPLTLAANRFNAKPFASPEQAANALFDAAKAQDMEGIFAILGTSHRDWILSGDRVQDMQRIERFVASYAERSTITNDGDAKALLVIGKEDFPFAFPIVKRGDKWSFDAEAGRDELLNRTIGRNELDTIQVLLAIVDAQHEYATLHHDRGDVSAYATRFRSRSGKRDGLYWQAGANEPESPLGPLVAAAERKGYRADSNRPSPFHGYYFRILTGQGPSADGGALSYVVRGRMIGGFAVLAYPARYGISGIKTFIVDNAGVVYERDFGPQTASAVRRIWTFDPDATWKAVERSTK